MKHVLYSLVLFGLFGCQKENQNETPPPPPVIEPAPAPVAVCKISSVQEYPAVDGNNVLRTFTYDDKNRVTKMEIKKGTATAVTKTITYNAGSLIEGIAYDNGAAEKFTYTNGVFTGWEALAPGNVAFKKSAFTYEGSKLLREDRYNYNTTTNAYVLNDYLTFEWDGNDNIKTIKTFSADNVLKATDTYAYSAEKLNKQTITPQINLLFMNWSNDITAFINSKYLLTQVTSKSRNLVYETNEAGLVTTIKTDRKDNLFAFTYSCN